MRDSSGSVTVTEQVKVSPLVTPLLGVMARLLSTGAVLSTVTESVEVAVKPNESVRVAVQVMVSPTLTSDEDMV